MALQQLFTPNRLFQFSSLALGLALGLPGIVNSLDGEGDSLRVGPFQLPLDSGWPALAQMALLALFLVLHFWMTAEGRGQRRPGRAILILGLQLLIAAIISLPLAFLPVAAIPLVFPARYHRHIITVALLFSGLVAGVGLLATPPAAMASHAMWRLHVLLTLAASLAWQGFAWSMGYLVMKARHAHLAQLQLNAELRILHASLETQARTTERMELLRNLHDGVGHHLSALGLYLQLAQRSEGEARGAALDMAQGLTRKALLEVRELVLKEREGAFDLAAALHEMTRALPTQLIRLEWDPDLAPLSGLKGHELFRCIQEALSNALRHAQADQILLQGRRAGATLEICIQDDGVGGAIPLGGRGSGLVSMRERIVRLGGTMAVSCPPPRGWRVELTLPLEAS